MNRSTQSKSKDLEAKRQIPQDIVESIRKFSNDGVSTGDLSVKFSLPKPTISNIIHNHTYYVKPKKT